MLELPEVLTAQKDLEDTILNKRVIAVLPPTNVNAFADFNIEPSLISNLLLDKKVIGTNGFGMYVEIIFENDLILTLNDGVNIRYLNNMDNIPNKYQLLIRFDDNSILYFTVSLYGRIALHSSDYDDDQYIISKNNTNITDDAFNEQYFLNILENSNPTTSVKAFLTNNNKFPGIGNGVIQDVLFNAKIHPKKKLESLDYNEKKFLYESLTNTVNDMISKNGRDTEKRIFGKYGSYKTILSKNTKNNECIDCGGIIEKSHFLGGTIYYCSRCQSL
ncbi:endonuclease VIII [Mycoplasma sp. P36-A1]|uniref:endonuclease VIII n=1 Tax=Mycoplasma sp. P36-A1 TaxID=3252900 RepID=UPI003C2FB596